MENSTPFEFDLELGNEVIEDEMWSLFQQTYSFDDDWMTDLPSTTAFDENVDENCFEFDLEKDVYQTASTVPIFTSVEEVKPTEENVTLNEANKPKTFAVATMKIVKPPLGWKFPEVNYIKDEKQVSKRNCCVLNCNNSPQKCAGRVKFHSFPGKPYEKLRKEMWIAAIASINRVNPDGTPWQPTKNSKVCSEHFVGGVVSNIASHPAYVPSIFPPVNKDSAESSRKPSVYKGSPKQSDKGE